MYRSTRLTMTIDLGTDVESTTVVAMATVNNAR